MRIDEYFIFTLVIDAISLTYSALIIKGFISIIKHKFSRSLSLYWTIEFRKRQKEIILIGLGAIFFSIAFFFDAISMLTGANLILISYITGMISYFLVGYSVSKWGRILGKI